MLDEHVRGGPAAAVACAAQGMVARIAAHDWARTGLGAREQWPAPLRATVDLMLAHGFPMIVLWGPDLIQLYNDGYAEVMGNKHPEGLGQPTATCWPEVWHINGPIYDQVWQGHTLTFTDKCYPLARRGPLEDVWFTITYSPLPDGAGAVGGVLVTMVETTQAHLALVERERVATELREAELRARTLVEGMAQAFWETDAQGNVVADSPSWRHYTGQALGQWQGRGWLEAVHPDDRAHASRIWADAVVQRRPVDAEYRLWHAANGNYRWTNVRAAPLLDADGAVHKWVGMNIDIDDRKQAEAALRESEQRLGLAFKMLPVGVAVVDPAGQVVMSNDLLRTYLPTNRVPSLDPGNQWRWQSWHADGRRVAPEDYAAARAQRGETVVPGMEFLFTHDDGRQTWTRVAAAPLFDAQGRVTAVFSIVMDIDALKRGAERLRENEERFRQFSAASSDVLWIREAGSLDAEFLSTAFDTVYGAPAESVMGALHHWAALVVPDDRPAAIAHLQAVTQGDAHVSEFRIQRRDDGAFRWIRDTAFPLFDQEGRVDRIAGISADVTETRRWVEHQGVLLAELQHRVRNIMAMINSIAWRTRQSASSVEEYAQLLSGRLMSLARTQALLTRAANVGVSMRSLVSEELAAQAPDEGQYLIEGEDVVVPPKAAEVLSLAVHELSTNALKYGALTDPLGRICVRWTVREADGQPWLDLHWDEQRPATPGWTPPVRRGFGTRLVEERVPYELAGQGSLQISASGVTATMAFPLRNRDSILETDAPLQPGVAGGTIDMSGEARLDGRRVLVIDDDFYQAQDSAGALRSAGAQVIGPCASLAAALAAISAHRLSAAVVDINLGEGPTFAVLAALQAASVPFVVVTGYDAAALPETLAQADRLQKPVTPRQVVQAIAQRLAR